MSNNIVSFLPELNELRLKAGVFLHELPAEIEYATQNECSCGSITSELNGCDYCSEMTRLYAKIESLAEEILPNYG